MYVTWWPPTVNNSYDYPPYVNTFTIHGIWPTFNNNSYPCNCPNINAAFNFTAIRSLYFQLETSWYDYYGPKSTNLWNHEWSKHGVCTMTNQYDWFSLGIALHNKYDFKKILEKNDIVPSMTSTYTFDQVYSAIKREHGVSPLIDCKIMDNIVALYRIIYCADKNYKLINCPECITWQMAAESVCTDEIYFLPLVQDTI
jgi:ribonuclease T2